MSTVRFSGPTNSTMFTTCCGVAVCDDQANCPDCGEEVIPRSSRGRWDEAMRTQAGGTAALAKLRATYGN